MSKRNIVLRDLERTLDRAEMDSVHGGQSDALLLLQTASIEFKPEDDGFTTVDLNRNDLITITDGIPGLTVAKLTQTVPLGTLQSRPVTGLRLGISSLF